MDSKLEVRLFGCFEVLRGGKPVTGFHLSRLQTLTTYLLLHTETPQPRQRLAFLIWPDASEMQARTNLRKALHYLRLILPDLNDFLHCDGQFLQWNSGAAYRCDVTDFEAALSMGDLEHALSLYRGDLLPDCYEEWIFIERDRLHQKYLEALARMVQQKENNHDYPAALGAAQRLLQIDPLREDLYRHIMRLHALNGDRAAALHVYQTCATVLQRELGIEPGPVTRQVYQQLLNQKEQLHNPIPLAASLQLVGRADEWSRLKQIWNQSAQGKPHMVLITGEAGIGKTHLAEELLVWVDRQGIPVSITHCYAVEGTSAYIPVSAWLRERILTNLKPVYLNEVARLLPEVIDREPGLKPTGPLHEPWQRQRFHDALARAVLGDDLTLTQPLLLLIEDLQWCDSDTLEWLNYLLRCQQRGRFLVIGTLRTDTCHNSGQLNALVNGLKRQGHLTEICLQPLNQEETAMLGRQVLEAPLDEETAACLYRETEGNPLFIVEFARAGLTDWKEKTDQTSTILPPAVQAAVSARLSQLSSQAQTVIELAAVVGRKFTFEVLFNASKQDEDTLIDALDELWQRRVIREQGKDAYDFSHDKLRQVVYGTLSPVRKQRFHKRVAEALVRASAPNTQVLSGQIAWHYEQARTPLAAADWYYKAGEGAVHIGALEDGLAYVSRALDVLPDTCLEERFSYLLARVRIFHLQSDRPGQLKDLEELQALLDVMDKGRPGDACSRAEIALERGSYLRDTSAFDAAVTAAEEALIWVDKAHRDSENTRQKSRVANSNSNWNAGLARLEFEALFLLGATLEFKGEFSKAAPVRQKALDLARKGGLRREEARALFGMAYGADTKKEAWHFLKKALPIFKEIGDRSGECECMEALGYHHLWHGEIDAALECYEQSLYIARQIGYKRVETTALFHLGHFYNHIGEYAVGKSWLEQVLSIVVENGDVRREAYVKFNISVSESGLGDTGASQKHVDEALAKCIEINDLNGQAIALYILAANLIEQKQWREAVRVLEESVELVRSFDANSVPHFKARLAYALFGEGKLDRALNLMKEVLRYLESGEDSLATDEGLIPVYLSCYRILNAAGDTAALQVLDSAYAYLQEKASRIKDQALKRSFLEKKKENRELLEIYSLIHAASQVTNQAFGG